MHSFCIVSLFSLLQLITISNVKASDDPDYDFYHKQIVEAEKLIGEKQYEKALLVYEKIFSTYEFIFLRDYQVATQLALHINDKQKATRYLKKGITRGWELKSIKKNEYLAKLRDGPEWKAIKRDYRSLRDQYEASINQHVRDKVRRMFSKDQWKALGALFTFSPKAQDRYAEKKFAPHSERHIAELIKILNEHGYPGEQLIGNSFWTMTMLSHHNSISAEYAQQDTLYQFLKPKLLKAINDGQMSPFEFAFIDDWYRTVNNRQEVGYGYLNPPSQSEFGKSDSLRQKAGLRTIEIRNQLVDIEHETGMNFYLPGNPWVKGKINIKE